MSRLLPISAWVRVFPPRTNRQATGRVKLFLKSVLTEESTLNSSWLCTRPFLSRERPAAGRVFAFNWWRGSCTVILCCCFVCKESSARVMPLEFSYTSELKLDNKWFWRPLLSIDVTAVLGNGAAESREPSDAADLSHPVKGSHQDAPLVVGLLSALSSLRKPDGIGVQGGAEWDVDGRMDKRKADEGTTPWEKQLRTGGDIPPRGWTVLQVRLSEKQLRKTNISAMIYFKRATCYVTLEFVFCSFVRATSQLSLETIFEEFCLTCPVHIYSVLRSVSRLGRPVSQQLLSTNQNRSFFSVLNEKNTKLKTCRDQTTDLSPCEQALMHCVTSEGEAARD